MVANDDAGQQGGCRELPTIASKLCSHSAQVAVLNPSILNP